MPPILARTETTADNLASESPGVNATAIDSDTAADARVTRPSAEAFELVWSDEFNERDRRKWAAQNKPQSGEQPFYNRGQKDADGRPIPVRNRNGAPLSRVWKPSNLSINEDEGTLNVQTKETYLTEDARRSGDPN